MMLKLSTKEYALKAKYTTTDKIKVWGKVVLVQFTDGTHNDQTQ